MKAKNKNKIRKIDTLISWNFKMLRLQRGITQKQVADAIGVSVQQVQKYESGVNRISSGTLQEIADLLGVNVTSFFIGIRGECS